MRSANRVETRLMKSLRGRKRKNWLSVGDRPGGERAAKFMTVPYSARLHEAETWTYLADALDRLARRRAEGDKSDASLDLRPDRRSRRGSASTTGPAPNSRLGWRSPDA